MNLTGVWMRKCLLFKSSFSDLFWVIDEDNTRKIFVIVCYGSTSIIYRLEGSNPHFKECCEMVVGFFDTDYFDAGHRVDYISCRMSYNIQ